MPLELIDELDVIKGITIEEIKSYLKEKGADSTRAGWYFQQFLKMAFSLRHDCDKYYVIWDADTILLRPFEALGHDGRALIQPSDEYHAPYFAKTNASTYWFKKSLRFFLYCRAFRRRVGDYAVFLIRDIQLVQLKGRLG